MTDFQFWLFLVAHVIEIVLLGLLISAVWNVTEFQAGLDAKLWGYFDRAANADLERRSREDDAGHR